MAVVVVQQALLSKGVMEELVCSPVAAVAEVALRGLPLLALAAQVVQDMWRFGHGKSLCNYQRWCRN